MTAAHEPNDIDGPHEGPIKTPKQLILAVLYAFVVPIFGIILLVMYVTADKRPAAGSDAMSAEARAERLRPVGVVEVKDASDPASLASGEQVFTAQCGACHTAGALGAPKLGDAPAWAARIKTGFDALVHSALAGKGQMPPQTGGDFSDYEIARAVVYMADRVGAKFPEPPPPAATTATTTTTAATAGAAPGTAMNPTAPTAGGAPMPNPNAGTPTTTPVAALNAQVKDVPPNVDPGKAKTQVAANAAAAAAVTAPTAAAAAPPLYAQNCSTCHTPGIAGAPKVGDKAAWTPRIAQGLDVLHANAIKGKGAMPPKGGSNASDADVKAVVTYMVNASK
jgi:cytochrome c5